MSDVERFVQAARAYCGLIDSITEDDPSVFDRLELALAGLYSSIVRVEMGPGSDLDLEPKGISHLEWKALAAKIDGSIGRACSALSDYLIELDGGQGDSEDASRARCAWDDLADIYLDLQKGFELWDRGDGASRADAVWHWRFDYESHWGWHLMRAALTVHQVKYYLKVW